MQLNYKIDGEGKRIILLHGLFGSLDNLGCLARTLAKTYQVIQVDLRNHGLSPWSDEMNYDLMAQDIEQLIQHLSLDKVSLIGHSMGGKVAMKLTQYIADKMDHLVVLDIAPVTYQIDSHRAVFDVLRQIFEGNITEKRTILSRLNAVLPETTTQFLLKSYKQQHWLFNFIAIDKHYTEIKSWQPITPYFAPILFIKGEHSDYLADEYQSEIMQQFPYSSYETINDAGHNVHVEKTEAVLKLITQWFDEN